MKIKRFAAILLVFALLATMFTAAKAQDAEAELSGESSTVQPETPDISEKESQTTEGSGETTQAPEKIPKEDAQNTVQMSICMRNSGFPAFFHVWIYIHNTSDEAVKVGAYDLPAGEGVSVGSWGMSVLDKWGIYYNIESYASRERTAEDYYVMTKALTLQELETVSEEITKWNYWDFFFNCTVFACRVWNCVGGEYILPVPLPLITLLQMSIHGAEKNALEMFVPDEERVYKQIGSGAEASLEKVEERSIDSFGASL